VISPRRGARVATLPCDEIARTIEIRAALEPPAVKYVLEESDASAFTDLDRPIRDLADAAANEDWSALVELDTRFHEAIFDLMTARYEGVDGGGQAILAGRSAHPPPAMRTRGGGAR